MKYNWKSDWIWMYESIWCSIEKFKFSNELTSLDIYKLTSASRRININYIYSSIYASTQYIKRENIVMLLDKEVFNESKNQVKDFLGPLYNDIDIEKYILYKWRYCPECIKVGYHSFLHQLNLFDKCIFHNINLETKCPSCKNEQSYVIDLNKNRNAYTCECGYIYINYREINNIFKEWESKKILNLWDNKQDIKVLEPYSKCFIFSYELFKNRNILEDENYFMNNTYIYDELKVVDKQKVVKFSPSLKNKYTPLYDEKNNIYDYLGLIFMNEYITIFKSIARNIIRSIKNIGYLKYYSSKSLYFNLSTSFSQNINSNRLSYKDIDENLYAYIMFRKEIEGHKTYSDIHTLLNQIDTNDSQYKIRMNISDTIIYKFFKSELSKYIFVSKQNESILFDDYGIFISSLEHVLSSILIQYYNNWVDYIRQMKSQFPDNKIDFNVKLPFSPPNYLVCWDENNKKCYLTYYR